MNTQNPFQKLEVGACYHIYNRGNNKESIFKEPQNYLYFLTLWKKYIQPIADTFCYNLLPNHFHFFIRVREHQTSQVVAQTSQVLAQTSQVFETCEVSQKPLEQNFSNLFNAYAKAINKKYNRTGSLFQERFRRKEITNDAYFTNLIGYIITNAAKHGICKKAKEYPHSAYAALISDSNTSLLRDEVLDWFGGREKFIEYINNYEENIALKKWMFEKEQDDSN